MRAKIRGENFTTSQRRCGLLYRQALKEANLKSTMKREKGRSRGADGFKQIRRESTREQGGKQGRLRKAGKAAVSRELGSKEEKDRAIGRKGKAEAWGMQRGKDAGRKAGLQNGSDSTRRPRKEGNHRAGW